jgi:pimeloyl-ACP methyl ester carboxylesterase
MPTARVNGVELYYEQAGEGFPLVFSHEYAGDYRSWEAQVRYFARKYRVITWNYRGYPPSSVPDDPTAYSEDHQLEDLHGLLRHLGIQQAHIAGLSMGGTLTMRFGIAYPELCKTLCIAGAGSGSDNPEQFRAEALAQAARLEQDPAAAFELYSRGAARRQLEAKDRRGHQEFVEQLKGHSATGMAHTMRGVQAKRKTLYEHGAGFSKLDDIPVLIMIGDEDEPCLETGLYLKRHLKRAGLVIFPKSGHCINLEEPGLFNQLLSEFLHTAEQGRWFPRGEITKSLLPAEGRL